MTRAKTIGFGWIALLGCAGLVMGLTGGIGAAYIDPVPYRILKEPSINTPDRVKVEVFVDFYCPHCHHFETTVLPLLEREFGDRMDVTAIGFPVIRNKPETPFLLYEAARAEGKGVSMARVLFRVLHDEKKNIQDPGVEAKVVKEAGLEPASVKKRLDSGDPERRFKEGIARAEHFRVHSTPTVLLDNYVLVEDASADVLSPLIHKLLAGEEIH